MEACEYSHYLITRFNVRIESMLTNELEKIDITCDKKYLTERLRLFFCYTVPSVISQTSHDFTWIILLSDNTPDTIKQPIENMKKSTLNKVVTLYVKDEENFLDILKQYIKSDIKTDVCITSRLDNDDALNTEYMKEVHKNVDLCQSGDFVLIFNNGYQYNEKENYAISYNFSTNHFSSLITHNSKEICRTVIDYNHMDIGHFFKVVNMDNKTPMWLEVVHESNVTNRMHIKSNSFVLNGDALNKFGLNIKLTRITGLRGGIVRIFQTPLNIMRLLKQYGIRKSLKKLAERTFS